MERRFRAKVTGKGQVQVPKPVREALGVKTGDELVFRVAEAGAVYVTSEPKITLSDLAGCLKAKVKYVGLQAEEDAGPDWAAERERKRLEEYRTGGAEEARKK